MSLLLLLLFYLSILRAHWYLLALSLARLSSASLYLRLHSASRLLLVLLPALALASSCRGKGGIIEFFI